MSLPDVGPRSRELNFVLEALRTASSVLRVVAPSTSTLEKSDRTPVTAADLGVQAVLAGLLLRAFPEDVLVAEESAEMLRRPEATQLRTEVVAAARVVSPEADSDQVLAWLDRGAASRRGASGPSIPSTGPRACCAGGSTPPRWG